jgi:CRISPR/Cas system-associated endonuclease Cas1
LKAGIKRPPKDPVNATISYLYGLLAKECFVKLLSVEDSD